MKKADLFFNVIRVPVDFAMLFLTGLATYLFRTKILSAFRPVQFEFNLPLFYYLWLVSIVGLVFIGLYAISGLYSMKVRIGKAEEFFKILIASSAGVMLVIMYIFVRQELFNSRFLILGAWLLAILFVCIGRLLVRYFQHVAVGRYHFGVQRVLLIGEDALADSLKTDIARMPASGYRIVDHWHCTHVERLSEMKYVIDEVLLVSPNYSGNHVNELIEFCHEHHIVFKFVPNLYESLTRHMDVDQFSHVPVIELKRTPLDGWGKVFKRTIDIVGASFGLVVFSPLFLAVAVAIKLDTPGPVFARLKRVSRNKQFILYKFRGMIAYDPDGGAESLKASLRELNERKDGPLFKIKNDPRVTRVGRVIRKYRIDELAQLINIFKGDMSLVGPRPHQPDEIAQYEKHHKKVLAIKAGATGLAQVSGSSDLPFDDEVKMDSYYIEHWSMGMDLKIIFKTMFKMLHDRSAA